MKKSQKNNNLQDFSKQPEEEEWLFMKIIDLLILLKGMSSKEPTFHRQRPKSKKRKPGKRNKSNSFAKFGQALKKERRFQMRLLKFCLKNFLK